jgi:hypothetical protein
VDRPIEDRSFLELHAARPDVAFDAAGGLKLEP